MDILLAEDDAHIARLIEFKLTREGFAVTRARDGGEAVSLLPARPWAAVILDVMMPVKDGWAVLRELRARPGMGALPVLMLTARGDQQALANAAELGATDFMKKPFDPAELAAKVRQICGKGADGLGK